MLISRPCLPISTSSARMGLSGERILRETSSSGASSGVTGQKRESSNAAARAVSDALPLLERARKVRVVTVTNEKILDTKHSAEELAKNSSRGVVNKLSDVKLLQGDLAEAWREGDLEYATVAMTYSLVDKTIDRTSGGVVEGSDQPVTVTELWTFMRQRDGGWLLSAIQQA